MRSICVFNNKGGVGKTTLLANLAAYLAIDCDLKVLVVDADPQCNATAYMLQESLLEKYYKSRDDATTINHLITSLKRSKGYGPVPVVRSQGFGVDLVLGDPKFSLAEDFLAKDWGDAISGEERGLKTTFLFSALLEWAENEGYDYVFFDVGPSLGAINRTVLLASDYFILPMSSDIFSLRGLQNIQLAIASWKRSLERGLSVFEEDNGHPFAIEEGGEAESVNIKFLGYVTQQYTAKTVDGKKQPVSAYEKIIRRIGPSVKKHLVDGFNGGISLNYKLGEIPYFQSVVPMSQSASKPIFGLKSADGVVGAHFDKVRQFHDVISSIAENIEANLEGIE
ncbi:MULTISPECIES: ParA family protein [unclassified Burkholderia]|uniref:ParA family protein n=1 Tax=unclassified Burkholderia TaxID=2613784 RepID=UPI000F5FB43C|nr:MULTISPECIES: AAA family ATPase [unclassified Burkholderia]RQZ46076.1 ParA family protein [Burkholderia sp. Bp9099]